MHHVTVNFAISCVLDYLDFWAYVLIDA